MKAPLAKIFLKNKNELFRKLFAHPRSEGKSIHLVWSITLSVDDLMLQLKKTHLIFKYNLHG